MYKKKCHEDSQDQPQKVRKDKSIDQVKPNMSCKNSNQNKNQSSQYKFELTQSQECNLGS